MSQRVGRAVSRSSEALSKTHWNCTNWRNPTISQPCEKPLKALSVRLTAHCSGSQTVAVISRAFFTSNKIFRGLTSMFEARVRETSFWLCWDTGVAAQLGTCGTHARETHYARTHMVCMTNLDSSKALFLLGKFGRVDRMGDLYTHPTTFKEIFTKFTTKYSNIQQNNTKCFFTVSFLSQPDQRVLTELGLSTLKIRFSVTNCSTISPSIIWSDCLSVFIYL